MKDNSVEIVLTEDEAEALWNLIGNSTVNSFTPSCCDEDGLVTPEQYVTLTELWEKLNDLMGK